MSDFTALRVHLQNETIVPRLERLRLEDLSPGEVVIRGAYSSINYKDALAVTGKGRILRRYPLVAGVDISGTVESSTDPLFQPGDDVVVTGGGLSETTDGGFTQIARVPGALVTPLPAGLDLRSAMAIGTAGFTAALALHRMEQNDQRPELGPIAVTGATGGVGSIAIDIFSGRGYTVTALTHKAGAEEYLRALGAAAVQLLTGMKLGTRPLEKAMWGGAVDSLGGAVLGWLTRTTVPLGNIASIGLAAGPELCDHGHAFHTARREPARHQLGRGPARPPARGLAAARRGPEACASRSHRAARGHARGAPCLLRCVHRGDDHRPHACPAEVTWMAPRVVIVGAGFGGIAAAKELLRAPVSVTLIDRHNYHLFQPLLYQVATAGLSPGDIAWPIRSIFRDRPSVLVLLNEVTGLDRERRELMLLDRRLPYDFLVVATGASHNYYGHPEWARFAPGLKSIEDATAIRGRILIAFESAEMSEDPAERERLLTFVIVGGGATGVELAGAIIELARKVLASDFRRINTRSTRVILVEAGERILPAFPADLSAYAKRSLGRLGVEVRTGQSITGCDAGGVWIDGRVPACRHGVVGRRAYRPGRSRAGSASRPTDRAGSP